MKYRLIFISIFLSSSSFATELTHDIGFKFAVTRSAISPTGSNYQGFLTQYRTGFNFAVCLEIYHSQNIHFLPQIEYIQKGYKLIYNDGFGINNYFEILDPDARFDYISFPIFVKFLLPGKDISGSISAGIRAEHMVQEHRAKIKTPDSSLDFYEIPDLRENNLGGSIMLGFDFRYSLPVIISLEFRYNFDFGSLTPTNDELNIGPTKNKSFDFWLGFRL